MVAMGGTSLKSLKPTEVHISQSELYNTSIISKAVIFLNVKGCLNSNLPLAHTINIIKGMCEGEDRVLFPQPGGLPPGQLGARLGWSPVEPAQPKSTSLLRWFPAAWKAMLCPRRGHKFLLWRSKRQTCGTARFLWRHHG